MIQQPPAQVLYAPCSQNEMEIVAATLIKEAGGESTAGMQAVFNVIWNRAKGNSCQAAHVCLVPRAFTVWNGKNAASVIATAKSHPCWQQAMLLTTLGLQGKLADITGGANHFYNPHKAHPAWAKKMTLTKVIGRHAFLKGN